MREFRYAATAALCTLLLFVAYMGTYFLAAEYVNVGSNSPLYLVHYRLGSLSLNGLSSFFEPARKFDEQYLSQRRGTTLTWDVQ